MQKRKICFITGSRADYGFIYWILKKLKNEARLQIQLVVSAMHLSPEFGCTFEEIEKDGFSIDEKVEMLLSSDSDLGIAKSTGLGTIGFSESLNRLKPDLVVVTGDRFETLSAATAAMLLQIPLAHIGGGEITKGAVDDTIRHAITKMSQSHFCSNRQAYKELLKMGESKKNVFCYGSPGLDDLSTGQLVDRKQLCKDLNIQSPNRTAVVTYHPATQSEESIKGTFSNILKNLDHYDGEVIFTGVNADSGGRVINQLIDEYVKENKNTRFCISLGRTRYLSLLKNAEVMIGNSSSGFCEAPSFKLPVVNIGDRQKGRCYTKNIIQVGNSYNQIKRGIAKALTKQFTSSLRGIKNPYHWMKAAPMIAKELTRLTTEKKESARK